MIIITHPAAANELNEAAGFYAEQGGRQLGLALIAEFNRVALLLSENPALGVAWVYATQRFVLRRFPFAVVYRYFPDTIFIIAVAHQKRRPGYWRYR